MQAMKIEQLNSATDGHKEITVGGVKSPRINSIANLGVASYDSLGTRVVTPPRSVAWESPDATPTTRTDGYGTAEKKPLRSCRY